MTLPLADGTGSILEPVLMSQVVIPSTPVPAEASFLDHVEGCQSVGILLMHILASGFHAFSNLLCPLQCRSLLSDGDLPLTAHQLLLLCIQKVAF